MSIKTKVLVLRKGTLILLLSIFFIINLLRESFAQQHPHVEQINISEGLSQGMIYDIKQDKEGFMWFSTSHGLNRHDGYRFKVFTENSEDKYSISGNEVRRVFIAKNGYIWALTLKNGVNIYDPKKQQFTRICLNSSENQDVRKEFESAFFTSINEDPIGNIWLGTSEGSIFRISVPQLKNFGYNIDKKIGINRVFKKQFARSAINNFFFSEHDKLIIFSKSIIFESSWKRGNVDPIIRKNLPTTMSYSSSIQQVNGAYWFSCTNSTLGYFKDGYSKSIIVENTSHEADIILNFTEKGEILVSSGLYIWKIKPEELLKKNFLNTKDATIKLDATNPKTSIVAVFEDKTGNIWVGLNGYGIRRFNPNLTYFRTFLTKYSVSNIFQDRRGQIYSQQSLQYRKIDNSQLGSNDIPNVPMAKNSHYALLEDKGRNFWILAGEKTINSEILALWKFSSDWKLLKKYALSKDKILILRNSKMLEDKDGKFWITLLNGQILHFDPESGNIKSLNFSHLCSKYFGLSEPTSIYIDVHNTLWIGTEGGLVKVSNIDKKPVFLVYRAVPSDKTYLKNNFVTSTIDDPYLPKRYLWVSTKGGGIERLNKITSKFINFSEADGLANNVVYGILEDENKKLWMSTNRGLSTLDPQTFIFKNYSKVDGLQDGEFNINSYFKAPTGELFFGGIGGINSFNPSNLKNIRSQPDVKIVELKINNRHVEAQDESEVLSESIEYTKEIFLTMAQNNISLELASMDYTNPKKNRFRYKLGGTDEQWVEIGTTPNINFSNLNYCDYTLLVSSTSDGEIWSEPVSLRIVMATPIFRRWYAILLYILAIIGAVWWLNQTRIQRIIFSKKLITKQNKIERLKELDTLKTTLFTNISHEFRTPLTLILGVSDLFVYRDSESQHNISVIKRNADKLMDMVNEILDLGKLEARKMEPNLSEINLRNFLEELILFFNAYGISNQVTLAVELPSDQLMIMADEGILEKIITNLIRNAFKFSRYKGQVKLKVSMVETAITQLNDEIEIIVSDDGIGISEVDLPHVFNRFYQVDSNRKVEGSGIGLSLVKEMVSVLKGSVSIKSKIEEGTEVYVKLPVVKMGLSQGKHSVILKEFPEERTCSPVENTQEKLVEHQNEQNLLLIVDDNADMRNYVNRVFRNDFQIIQVSNAIDGLALAHTRVPDLIISDLMMPEMDGHEFCKNIKSDMATSHIPFILLTANVSKEARLEAFKCGVDDCLTKPFDLEEIVTRVSNLIAQRERLQKIYSDKIFSSNQPPVPSYSFDDLFLNKAKLMAEHNLSNADFGVEQFSEKMNISTSQLLRKLKALTSLTTVEFLRDLRLQKSTELLMQQDGNIIEISEQVGFTNPSYFAKIFQEKYGISPSNFRK